MPVLVAGGDSDYASKRDLQIFSLWALIDKRNTSKTQVNVIGLYTFTKRVPFLETLTTKSPILVQKKMTTKIHPSATVIKKPSKKQHVKNLCPQK